MKKYDSYKDSGIEWIGEIPSHWILGKIKYSDTVIMGQSPLSDDCNSDGNGLPFLQGNAEFGKLNPTPKLYCEIPNKIADINDVLLSVRAPVGALNIANQKFGIGRGLCAIRQQKSNYKYIYYWLLHSNKELDSISTGSTFKAISLDDVKNINFPSMDIYEQTTIANYLDQKTTQIDHLIAKKEQFIQLLEEERVTVINQAVTKGIDPTVPMKDSGIEWLGEIPEHWVVKKLKHITSKVTDGSHFSPPTESEGRFYISVTDITKSNSINFENSKRISDNSFEELARNGCKPIKGDILITKDGTIGRGVIVEDFDDFVILSSLGLIRLNNKQNPYYILFYLLSGLNIDQMYSNIRGSGITRLTIKLINDLIVVVPSFEEQIEIENYLKLKTIEIDKVIIKSKQEIELLKEYKTALISEVVTGKVDVRDYSKN
jgi:type I restriction enzyme S subunit